MAKPVVYPVSADLSALPSINLTGPGCGWHGWIRNGEVTSC